MPARFELDPIGVEVYLMTNPELAAHLLAVAEEGVNYGKSIAPVGPHEHRLKSGYTDKPGDYRDAFEASVVQGHRRMKGRVRNTDYKRFWIEYGTKKMPKQGIMRKVADHLGASMQANE